MSVFSQRYGYSEDQGIQYERVGKRLRNRLWNHFFSAEYDADPFNRHDDSLTKIERMMDGLGLTFNIPRSPTARATIVSVGCFTEGGFNEATVQYRTILQIKP